MSAFVFFIKCFTRMFFFFVIFFGLIVHTHTHIDSRRRRSRSNSSGDIRVMHKYKINDHFDNYKYSIMCQASLRPYTHVFYKCASAIRKQLNKYLQFLRALFDCFFLVVFGLFFLSLCLSLFSFFLPFHYVLQCSEFGNIY